MSLFPHAYMDRGTFESLLEYSLSIPTGTTIGKRWKAFRHGRWFMGEYTPCEIPGRVGIRWSVIVIGSPATDVQGQQQTIQMIGGEG